MTEKKTDYVEAVGLILIGFALYECVFGQAATASGLGDWGPERFMFVACVATAVVFTLGFLQNFRFQEHELEADSEFKSTFPKFWSLTGWVLIFVLSLQFVLPYVVTLVFSPKAGAVFGIGFIFLDIAIVGNRFRNSAK